MKYLELTVHTHSEASELVADAMWEFTSYGVTVCDFNDILSLRREKSLYWDYIDDSLTEEKSEVLVKCYFDPADEEKVKALLKEIENRRNLSDGCLNFGTLEATTRIIEGDDWIEIWKSHFRPIPLGKIVVVPEWIEYQAKPEEKVVLLDSNMAFGTGEHETTRMCVEFLQKYLREGDVVLDVGCGSGILGIAAAKLGAKFCYSTDIDPIAVESAKHNALKNNVSEIEVTECNLVDDTSMKADLILANITAEILLFLAPAVPAHLKEGGRVILSGILKDRKEKVANGFEKAGLKVVEEREMGEWVSLVLKG